MLWGSNPSGCQCKKYHYAVNSLPPQMYEKLRVSGLCLLGQNQIKIKKNEAIQEQKHLLANLIQGKMPLLLANRSSEVSADHRARRKVIRLPKLKVRLRCLPRNRLSEMGTKYSGDLGLDHDTDFIRWFQPQNHLTTTVTSLVEAQVQAGRP